MGQIHLLWRDLGSCMAPMAYNELAGMMSKALEQLQMFKSKVSMPAGWCGARSRVALLDAACKPLCCAPGCLSSVYFCYCYCYKNNPTGRARQPCQPGSYRTQRALS